MGFDKAKRFLCECVSLLLCDDHISTPYWTPLHNAFTLLGQKGQQHSLSPFTHSAYLYLIICACPVKERCLGDITHPISYPFSFSFSEAEDFRDSGTVVNHRDIIHLRESEKESERETEGWSIRGERENEQDTCRYEERLQQENQMFRTK